MVPRQNGLSVVKLCGPSAPPVFEGGQAHSFGEKKSKRGQKSSSLFSFLSSSSLYITKVTEMREVTNGHFLSTRVDKEPTF